MKRWVVVLVMLGLSRVAAAQLLSPGPLASAHANIDTDDDCGKCHESGNKVVARLCFDCHKDLAAEMNAGRGLHGKQYKGQDCASCHVEHVGRNAKLVRWPGGSLDKLDHRLTGYPLEGKHAPVKCLDCHKKTSPLGKSQFLGTSTACGACHKDPHAGRFGQGCEKCHAVSQDFKAFDQKQFDHKLARYQLENKHLEVACDKCHTGSPPKWKPLEFATCESCHQDPHRGQFKPKACAACHDTRSWEGATDLIKRNHPRLSLANGHARVACKTCHDRGNDKPPSKGSRCESCHAPVHIAKFGTKCESCHASIKWVGLPDTIGREHHNQTRYPLAGKHDAVACASCHKPSRPQAKRYRGIEFALCVSCHSDQHKGEFLSRKNGECAQCHTVQGYTPTLFGLTEHATTAMPLEGKHAATPCKDCHTGARPRLDFKVAKKVCADCHANPHGDQFAKEMAQGGCAHCHTAADWHQAKVDHSTWPLLGAHARTACAACHGEQKKGAEPAAYRGIPRDCEGCHDDIHAGQFRQTQPEKGCKTCHTADTFKIAQTFDHSKTRYPLEGKHKGLDCGKCHMTEQLRDGSTAVRWRLGYVKCKDCHANPHTEAP
ncbi:MAG: cytochrome c3 family protein [Acidobacteriota bacterium]